LDKGILEQYIDACELIKETETDIRQLKKRRKTIIQDSVKGSMPEFPYAPHSFHIEGIAYSVVENQGSLDMLEKSLKERISKAEDIKGQVENWMNTIPQRMQRIIRYKIFNDMTWNQVAVRMGRKATAESVRKEFQRFIDEN
jgi:hypothetical protein